MSMRGLVLSATFGRMEKTMIVEHFQLGATTLQENSEANKIEVSDQAGIFRSLLESDNSVRPGMLLFMYIHQDA